MRKLVLSLGLVLILAGWGSGYYDWGLSPAHGQPQPYLYDLPPGYPPGYQYCDPYNYCTYYSAPYADPYTQFFFYGVPQIGGQIFREHERRERREHRGYEHPR